MRNLFLKIFLWFWVGIVLVAVAAAVTSMWAASHGLEVSWREHVGSMIRLSGHTMAETVRRDGVDGLPAAAEKLRQDEHIDIYVIGRNGEDLAHPGVAPPEPVVQMAGHHQRRRGPRPGGRQPRFMPWQGRMLVARHLRATDGPPLTVVMALPKRPALAHLVQPRTLAVRLLTVLIIATVLCYLLARYLTAPVRRLRAATAEIAAGNLGVRVGPAVGRRRDEIADLARDFDRMAERLQEILESRERLLRDVSHELRSPLSRLNVSLELARRESAAGGGEALDRMQREANRLNELIGEVLTLTRLGVPEKARTEADVDIADLVREVADDARFEAGVRHVSVRVVAAGEAVVRGVRTQLRSAIENVIRNAVRFSPDGGAVDVEVGRSPEAGCTSITVRDQGPGVPDAQLAQLFDPFFRADAAREPGVGGSGLGLAIARRAIELHGGTIEARNRSDGGLEVDISLTAAGPTS